MTKPLTTQEEEPYLGILYMNDGTEKLITTEVLLQIANREITESDIRRFSLFE